MAATLMVVLLLMLMASVITIPNSVMRGSYMDYVRTNIPYSFLKPRARDKLRNGSKLLDPGTPVDIGVERFIEEDYPSPAPIDLASLNRGEDRRPLVAPFAAGGRAASRDD